MGLFGSSFGKRKRPFEAYNAFPGLPEPGFTPGIGDGHNQEQQAVFSQAPTADHWKSPADEPEISAPMQAPERKGLFGSGTIDKLSTLGNDLAQASALWSGDTEGYAALDKPSAMQLAQAAEAKRRAELQDYEAKQRIAQKYQTPSTNDTERDYNFWKANMTPEQFTAWVQNKADPPQYRQGADGQFYRISGSQRPTAPVGRLTPIGNATPAGGQAPGVTPQAEQMRLSYIAALGPQQGEIAFREWLQKTGGR